MLKQAGILCAALLVLGSVGAAQNNRFDIALGASGALSSQASGNGTTLAPTQAVGFLVTGRFRFTPKFAIAGNFDRFRNSHIYTVPPNVFRIHTKISEYSGALVFTPKETEKFEPFFLGGVGVLRFYPDYNFTYINGFQVPVYVVNQNRLVFIYGGGLNYTVIHHIGLRLQYRGLVFTAPTMGGPGFFTGSREHIAEPSLSVAFKF